MASRNIMIAVIASIVLSTRMSGAEPPLDAVARSIVGATQGVFARAQDGTVLASVNAERPVHPASVTKVATTLALLRELGPDHRFETRVLATGPVDGGALRGDLVIDAAGDPFFVYENALLVLDELRALGVRSVDGRLAVRGPLLFNWRPDPDGRALRRALEGRDGGEAWDAVRPRLHASRLEDLALAFGGRPAAAPKERVIVVHRSPPLRRIVKALNCYSNNVFHLLADTIGGAAAVERVARAAVDVPADEIVIDNAAGEGRTNRLSPRAAAAVLVALEDELARHRLTLPDVLPVARVDPGTLEHRLGDAVVGKTGTIGSLGASALAGVAGTRRWGEVTFAVLDRGLPVPDAQRRQDAFVEAILRAGEPVSWPHRTLDVPVFAGASLERGG